ncbi:alpha/beta-type small acid-soluble spore protein [Tumebacillus permanentifrigoris]|uniref:alpha/beta-type small acid-soluble spore protein n=1 Tax=Tumebacillus permanentifrigoris TaxID=378543 RepID=UPI000D6A97C1|nr:alpha/beta-type small acid-soluble spore protein [Tumebacillus permanentifrigoris]
MSVVKKWNLEDPEIRRTIERLKWEIAQEYGIPIPSDGYWGRHASKDLGKIGSQLQKRLPLLLEHQKRSMGKKNVPNN